MHAGFVYSFAWLMLAGCGQEPQSPASPFHAGGTVGNLDGHGLAEVWGISFYVPEAGSHEAASEFRETVGSNPKYTNAIYNITLGNVRIVLEKRPGVPVTLAVNGKRFGSVEVGSKVEIDEKRNVKVNGTAREPTE